MATRASALRGRRFLDLVGDLRTQAIQDRLTGLAAEVAFFAVLSIFPGLLMIAAALGHLELLVGSDLAARSQQEILNFLDLILTDQASGALGEVEALFEGGRPGIVTIASVGALWALSRGFAAVIRALNVAYEAPEQRPWLKLRLLSLALSLGGVLVVALTLAMIVLGPLMGRGEEVADFLGAGDVFAFAWRWARWPIAFVVMVAGATIMFRVAPNCERDGWRREVPGALLSAILWLAVSTGFAAYLRLAPGANAVLGALGGGLILLVWLYLLSLSLLLGGELNSVLQQRRAHPGL